jgi:serine/threonine protein kinase
MTTSDRDAPQVSNTLAEVLGSRYEVVEKLGAGAFGEVYRAKDTVLGRDVAIKRIRLEAFAEGQQLEEVKKRFINEARVAAQLRHPNIVTTHDIVDSAKSSFIVMELVEGRTLQSLLESKRRLSIAETVDVLAQAAEALDYAHGQKVVHRDVKPANLMIEPNGHVKVMDFGIAKAESSGHITATGTVLGTPFYMSPEQAKGQPVDGRSDLFSLASIAYECLSGERPFQAEQITAILLKIVNEDPPPIAETLGLPSALTGSELVDALRQAGSGVSPAPTAGVTALSSPPPESGAASATVRASEIPRNRRWVPAVAALGVVAALGLWMASGSTRNSDPGNGAETSAVEGASDPTAAPSSLVVVEDVGFFGRLVGAEPKLRITIPEGTSLSAQLEDSLSSETAEAGEAFVAHTTKPISIEGHEALAAGARIEGHVAHAESAGKVSGTGEITLEFDRIVTPDGFELALAVEPLHRVARTTRKRDAAKVGGAAGIGALVGGLIGGKKGAVVGGAVGAGAGTGAVLATKGEEVVLPEGTELTIRLEEPVQVTIEREPE